MNSWPAARTLIGISLSMLILASGFTVLNQFKTKQSQTDAVIVSRMSLKTPPSKKKSLPDEVIMADAAHAVTEAEARAVRAEKEIAQAQKETADLRAKVNADQAEIISLHKNIEETTSKAGDEIPGVATASEMEAQLDESRRALDSAEQEKEFLLSKLRSARERSAQLEDQRKRRAAVNGKPGVRGTVLAVNQAYNFVVLNLGGKQGVEVNSEMLVVRDGALIGKIRISSVEPATAIGDIVTSSLARGVQVQRGDVVVYAGSSS